ncbi:MAG: hypothetical protein HY927_07000 [Elusimicrobia bacterium]|nr:hypothetical protein [Elusimicrobiota bacterium]
MRPTRERCEKRRRLLPFPVAWRRRAVSVMLAASIVAPAGSARGGGRTCEEIFKATNRSYYEFLAEQGGPLQELKTRLDTHGGTTVLGPFSIKVAIEDPARFANESKDARMRLVKLADSLDIMESFTRCQSNLMVYPVQKTEIAVGGNKDLQGNPVDRRKDAELQQQLQDLEAQLQAAKTLHALVPKFGEAVKAAEEHRRELNGAAYRLAEGVYREVRDLAEKGDKRGTLPYEVAVGKDTMKVFDEDSTYPSSWTPKQLIERTFRLGSEYSLDTNIRDTRTLTQPYLIARAGFSKDLGTVVEQAQAITKLLALFVSLDAGKSKTVQELELEERRLGKPLDRLLSDMGWDSKKRQEIEEAMKGLQDQAGGLSGPRSDPVAAEKTRDEVLKVVGMLEDSGRLGKNPEALAEIVRIKGLLSKRMEVPGLASQGKPAGKEGDLDAALATAILRLPLLPEGSALVQWAKRHAARAANLATVKMMAVGAGVPFAEKTEKDRKGRDRAGVWVTVPGVGERFDSGDGFVIEKSGRLTTKTESDPAYQEQRLEGDQQPFFWIEKAPSAGMKGKFEGKDFAISSAERYQLNKDGSGRVTGVMICRESKAPNAPCDLRHALYREREEIYLCHGKGFILRTAGKEVVVFPDQNRPFFTSQTEASEFSRTVREKEDLWLLKEVPDSLILADRKRMVERFLARGPRSIIDRALLGLDGWKVDHALVEKDTFELAIENSQGKTKTMYILNLAGLGNEKEDKDYRKAVEYCLSQAEGWKGEFARFPEDYRRLHVFEDAKPAGFLDMHVRMSRYVEPKENNSRSAKEWKVELMQWHSLDKEYLQAAVNCDRVVPKFQVQIVPPLVSKGLEVMMSPFQNTFYNVVGHIQRGEGALLKDPEKDFAGTYTQMQAKFAEWSMDGYSQEDRAGGIYQQALSRLDKDGKRRIEAGLDELVKEKRKELWGEFMADRMGPVTTAERAAFAYENFGLAKAPGYYFRQGQKMIESGDILGGAASYAWGATFIVEEGLATGLMFGEVAGALRFLTSAKLTGYPMPRAVELLKKVKGVKGADLKTLNLTAEEMEVISTAGNLDKIQKALSLVNKAGGTAASSEQFIIDLVKGEDSQAAWDSFNKLYSDGVGLGGFIPRWGAQKLSDVTRDFVQRATE